MSLIFSIGLSVTTPPQAPRIFSRTTERGIPLPALLLTSSISGLCFGSTFIGNGTLWSWLQNLVGVSNQVCPKFRYYPRRLIATLRLLGYP
jgi:amino acid permease